MEGSVRGLETLLQTTFHEFCARHASFTFANRFQKHSFLRIKRSCNFYSSILIAELKPSNKRLPRNPQVTRLHAMRLHVMRKWFHKSIYRTEPFHLLDSIFILIIFKRGGFRTTGFRIGNDGAKINNVYLLIWIGTWQEVSRTLIWKFRENLTENLGEGWFVW